MPRAAKALKKGCILKEKKSYFTKTKKIKNQKTKTKKKSMTPANENNNYNNVCFEIFGPSRTLERGFQGRI
uniref:Predicted protein n=1 Tax=Hordeum vulgare subsp. vulgare TaxID=112509 RepID=F2DX05_HORVV|nr:predicted protein [Hordeum vulgare subsp. vulgare]